MKKSAARLIVFAVVVMIALNGILIWTLWDDKSTNNRKERPPVSELNEFIIREMGFNDEEASTFRKFASRHHENQMQIQANYRDIKRRLNAAMIDQDNEQVDLLIEELSKSLVKKEQEFFRFFSDVMSIIDESDRKKFGKIFREATGAPPHARMPLNPNRLPPPKH
ncbi:hypothetical protein [Ekhidna sp.]